MIGKLLKNFFFFLMPGGGGGIALIVLLIITIMSSPNSFRGFVTPIFRVLIFSFSLFEGENCLVVPPVGIVPRVLHYLKSRQAVGTLVVPLWPSAHFWPLITLKYSSYLVAHGIHIGKEVLAHVRNPNSLLGSCLEIEIY